IFFYRHSSNSQVKTQFKLHLFVNFIIFYLQKFKCKSGENCRISVSTKNCCKKCRLEKCFKLGMKRKDPKKPFEAAKKDQTLNCIDQLVSRFCNLFSEQNNEDKVFGTKYSTKKNHYKLGPYERDRISEVQQAMAVFAC